MDAKLLLRLATFGLAIGAAYPARAVTLTFEDLAAAEGAGIGAPPSGYGGIQTWTNFYSIDTRYWPTYAGSSVSPYGILFYGGGSSTLSNPTAFTINDFYISASNGATSNDFTFTGYDGATVVDTLSMTIGTTPTDVVLNWSGLTSFNLTSYNHGTTTAAYYALDNLTLNQDVPEPASLAVLGVGLLGLWKARRRGA